LSEVRSPGNRRSRRHPRWATTKETAKYLSITVQGVRGMRADGRLRGYYLGRRMLRFDLNEVDDALIPGDK
jgi:excisionase family DNA binding protein